MERYGKDIEYESHVERCANDVQYESDSKSLKCLDDTTKSSWRGGTTCLTCLDDMTKSCMERYGKDIEYESRVERCANDVQYESEKKYLEYLMVDTTKSCIECEGSNLYGTPRCYPGEFPTLNEKNIDSGENEGSKLNGTPRCYPGEFPTTVIEKEYCHLDDGIKLSTCGIFVTTASGDMVFDVRHSLQCEFVEVDYVENTEYEYCGSEPKMKVDLTRAY
jgi:hypothetical protein